MKKIISRLTMKCLGHSFRDVVSGEGVYDYVDKYGDRYLANYPFRFWSFRVKKNDFVVSAGCRTHAEESNQQTADLRSLVATQQLTIQSLENKVNGLQESYDRRQEWLSKAKREAGADIRKSFDDVWKEALQRPTWDDVRKAIYDAISRTGEGNNGEYFSGNTHDIETAFKDVCEQIIEKLKKEKK